MFEVLKYVIENKIYWKGMFLIEVIIAVAAILITIHSSEIKNLWAGIAFIVLLILGAIISEYNEVKHIPLKSSPITLLTTKHRKLLLKHSEMSLLNINELERKRIGNELEKYQIAIKLLEDN